MDFNLRVVLHLAGILLSLGLLVWSISQGHYATITTLGLILVFQVVWLLRVVHTTNRQLARFLLAVRHGDFSQSFRNTGTAASFRELGAAFEDLIAHFRGERSDKEAQAAYLHALVEQMPIGLLALDEDGSIALSNRAFRQLVQRQEVNQLSQVRLFNPALADSLEGLKPGVEQSVEIMDGSSSQFLTLSCTLLRSEGRQQKLVSIQNIRSAIEAREMMAWQNLIRVMTHEIMNSITPITSLSETARELVQEARDELQAAETQTPGEVPSLLEDADNAISTIGNRSQGLMRFVESYRILSRVPAPRMRSFRARTLIDSVLRLMQEQVQQAGIDVTVECQPVTVEITADPDMLEQALINILKNAIEAFGNRPSPSLAIRAALLENRKVAVEITDNGCGMDAESLENLFIPFYTTKRGGSGIGMSLVKQIINRNEGSVRVSSTPGAGTTVLISLKAGL